jgi:hypothetical protein
MDSGRPRRSPWSWWYLLFILVCGVSLWPPLFNRVEPTLAGVPFFYWFQLALVLAGAVSTVIVYFATED